MLPSAPWLQMKEVKCVPLLEPTWRCGFISIFLPLSRPAIYCRCHLTPEFAQQSHPLPPGMGDVAQLFADEVIAFQIMLGTHQFAEAQALGFVIAEGAHFDEGQELLLSEGGDAVSGGGHGSRSWLPPQGLFSDLQQYSQVQSSAALEKSAVAKIQGLRITY